MTSLPAAAGLGFKPEHFNDIAETRPRLGFFEIHAENYMGAGGPPHRLLAALRRDYAISLHGVGLSIGAPGRLNRDHLDRLRALVDRHGRGGVRHRPRSTRRPNGACACGHVGCRMGNPCGSPRVV